MNFKFNRKPLKEKIYKWYVCGYYDINARAVEDNLTTNDVEEAKDFAWELVNRGDFVIVKNMHNGKSAIINEDDAFDDVSEYLNDIFRSIDGRTNESLKEGDYYRDNGFHRVEWGFMDEYDKSLIKDWLVSKHPEVIDDCIAYYGVHNFDDISNFNVWSWVSDTGNESLYDDFKRFLKHRNYNESLKEDREASDRCSTCCQIDFFHTKDYDENVLRDVITSALEEQGCSWSGHMDFYDFTDDYSASDRLGKKYATGFRFDVFHKEGQFDPEKLVAPINKALYKMGCRWYKDIQVEDNTDAYGDDIDDYFDESLKEDISDYEIDKVYKKLSKLNKVDFGALEDEYLETKPSVKDAVYKFYGTILNTKRYCKDFVQWAKEEKGIDLKGLPCKESYRRR